MSTFYKDFRDYLRAELEKRQARRPYYSMRAFARDLEISPSTLTELMGGRYGLSRARALDVGRKLLLPETQMEHFADLMMLKQKGATEKKRLALTRVKHRVSTSAGQLSLDLFRIVADWYHFAILELFYLDGFEPTPKKIAQALRIKAVDARKALERLQNVGLLVITEQGLKVKEDFTFAGDDVPAEAVRLFHKQILDRAHEAIFNQTVDERELSASIVSVRKADLPALKQHIRKFVKETESRFADAPPGRDAVYCLALQCFSLTESSPQQQGASDENASDLH